MDDVPWMCCYTIYLAPFVITNNLFRSPLEIDEHIICKASNYHCQPFQPVESDHFFRLPIHIPTLSPQLTNIELHNRNLQHEKWFGIKHEFRNNKCERVYQAKESDGNEKKNRETFHLSRCKKSFELRVRIKSIRHQQLHQHNSIDNWSSHPLAAEIVLLIERERE